MYKSLKNIMTNFKHKPLSCDPKFIIYIKIFRKFVRDWKSRISLISVIFILTCLFQIFIYDTVKDNYYYNTIILFLTMITFFGLFFPAYFRKDISKKDITDTIKDEEKRKEDEDKYKRRSKIGF